jgi:flagellar biosynthesis protein FliQ
MDAFDGLLREMLLVTAMLSLPTVAICAVVGAAIAIAQAATQVQEQTITLLPKMLAVALVIAFFGRVGIALCIRLFNDVIAAIPSLAR